MLAFDARHPDYNQWPTEPVQQVVCREYLGDLDRGIEGYLWLAAGHRQIRTSRRAPPAATRPSKAFVNYG